MSGKIAVVIVVILVILLGMWLNIPNKSNADSEWPATECRQFFGDTNAAEILCRVVEVLTQVNNYSD